MRKIKPKSYDYMEMLIGPESALKQKARFAADQLGLGLISLSPVEAGLLKFFAGISNAKKIVEIGTLTGLSALSVLENSGSDVKIWTLEKSPEHARAAEEVLSAYIAGGRCNIVVGDAREKLSEIQPQGPFDLVFIDGNKAAYLDYFNWSAENLKTGGLIIADNVFLSGAVWGDPTEQKFNEKQIGAVKRMNELAFQSKNFESYFVPTEEGMLVCKKL
jgi:predicted O-methyltransferase YrrM